MNLGRTLWVKLGKNLLLGFGDGETGWKKDGVVVRKKTGKKEG